MCSPEGKRQCGAFGGVWVLRWRFSGRLDRTGRCSGITLSGAQGSTWGAELAVCQAGAPLAGLALQPWNLGLQSLINGSQALAAISEFLGNPVVARWGRSAQANYQNWRLPTGPRYAPPPRLPKGPGLGAPWGPRRLPGGPRGGSESPARSCPSPRNSPEPEGGGRAGRGRRRGPRPGRVDSRRERARVGPGMGREGGVSRRPPASPAHHTRPRPSGRERQAGRPGRAAGQGRAAEGGREERPPSGSGVSPLAAAPLSPRPVAPVPASPRATAPAARGPHAPT